MQSEERKPFDLKYAELAFAFNNRANRIEINSKISLRTCEILAQHLARVRPKTAIEFEEYESLKDFVIKTSRLNEHMIDFIEYMKIFCDDVLSDAAILRQAHLINVNKVKKYLRGKGGEIEMEDGSIIQVSVRKKNDFLDKYNL